MGCASSHPNVLSPVDFHNIPPQVRSTKSVLPAEVHGKADSSESKSHRGFHEQFTVVDKLGTGAFARVYHSVRRSDRADFAVKVTDLRAPLEPGAEKVAKRELCRRSMMICESEVEILKQIGKQEHCISMIDSFVEGFLSYIVMELCEMTLLQSLERSSNLNELLYAKVFRDMLSALASIHALDIVHLDVKPDNFLCSGGLRGGVVKLCDFGLAKNLRTAVRSVRDVHGTAPFMAPEMLLKKGYDEKADVWSFAVIVYVLFFGHFPYQPADRSPKAMKVSIAEGSPAPDFVPRQSLVAACGPHPHLSILAEDFSRQALLRDPELRPSSKKALQHPWLSPTTGPLDKLPSLRPILHSATMAGAFTRGHKKNKKVADSVDNHLSSLQAHQGLVKKVDASKFGSALSKESMGSTMASFTQTAWPSSNLERGTTPGTMSSFGKASPTTSQHSGFLREMKACTAEGLPPLGRRPPLAPTNSIDALTSLHLKLRKEMRIGSSGGKSSPEEREKKGLHTTKRSRVGLLPASSETSQRSA
mmetsp:Transcript_80268/g.210798  ORF Transcript_80268/g.210798 Transcript_80268/m.210798 type:complete len:532 (-) Transcript_80268:105-1700(-)